MATFGRSLAQSVADSPPVGFWFIHQSAAFFKLRHSLCSRLRWDGLAGFKGF